MKRAYVLALIFLSVFLAGCQSELVTTEDAELAMDPSFGEKVGYRPNDGFCFEVLDQPFLMGRYQASEEIEYEVFEWTYPEGGGVGTVFDIESWPEDGAEYQVGLIIPPGALPEGHGPIDFRISVPAYDPMSPHDSFPPMVFELEPHGIQFDIPVRVMMSYPPWLRSTLSTGAYEVMCLVPEFSKDSELVRVDITDYQRIYPNEKITAPSSRFVFETTHFSTWAVNGDEGVDGVGGFDPIDGDSGGNELDNPVGP